LGQREEISMETITAKCGCVVEATGEMNMVQYCDDCRPLGSVGAYLCICGRVFYTFEELQEHAYQTDCLFPEVREVAA
jgi:hypothetical protein